MDWRRFVPRRKDKEDDKKPRLAKAAACPRGNLVESGVQLPGLTIAFLRNTELPVPHEVSIIIPRAEIRYVWAEGGQHRQAEIILNSITLVDSPRHPSAGEQPPAVTTAASAPAATSAPTAPRAPAVPAAPSPPGAPAVPTVRAAATPPPRPSIR